MNPADEVSLRQHLESRLAEMDRRIYEAIHQRDKAVQLAVEELKERLILLNELRENVASRLELEALEEKMAQIDKRIFAFRGEFVSVQTYDARHKDLDRRLTAAEKWMANVTGRGIGVAIIGTVFVAAVSGFIVHLLS